MRFWTILLSTAIFATAAAAADKPNIVVMMVDDVGYGDIGAFTGGTLRGASTPNLNRMATEGMRFTSFYTQPTCTPTRASLMTGRLPIREGFLYPLFPGIPGGLHPDAITIAELLEDSYYSAVIGKWHLGDTEINLPHRQGFDEFWGFLYHCDAYLYPEDREWKTDTPVGRIMKIKGIMEGQKGSTAKEVEKIDSERLKTLDFDIANRSADFIKTHAGDDEPFFLFTGFSKAHYKNFPHPDFDGKSESGVYGDALMELDHLAGVVLDAVRDAGVAENTLVLWMSDNGPSLELFPESGFTPFRGAKGETWEGGVRMPCIAWWPGTVPAGQSTDGIVTTMDLFSTFAALGGAAAPKDRPIDGNDQTALLRGEGPSETQTVYYYNGPTLAAIRNGNYKSHFYTQENWPDGELKTHSIPQLYNLKYDPQERHNVVYLDTWEVVQANMLLRQHEALIQRFPHRASALAR